MANNLDTRDPDKPATIDLSQEHAVRYWTEALGVSAADLTAAVTAVGSEAEAVREHLRALREGGGGPNTAVEATTAAELIPKPYTSKQD